MTNTVPFPSSSANASQQYTYQAPSGFVYVLYKLPAMRYLHLANALTTYFGQQTIAAVFAMARHEAEGADDAGDGKTNANLMEEIAKGFEAIGGFGRLPLDAFSTLARFVCPFVGMDGKPPVSPDEANPKMVDAKIDLLFSSNPSDILPVVVRAIIWNMQDFFSVATSTSFRAEPKESS